MLNFSINIQQIWLTASVYLRILNETQLTQLLMPKHADAEKKAFSIGAFEAGYSKSEISSYTDISRTAMDRLLCKSAEFSSGKSLADPT